MASGIQYHASLSATTWTQIAAGPASNATAQVLTVSVVNRGAATATISLAMSLTSAGTTPASSDYLLYQNSLPPGGVFEEKVIVLAYGYQLLGWASTGNFSFTVHGLEGGNGSTAIGRVGAVALTSQTLGSGTSIWSGPASGRMATTTVQLTNSTSSAVTIYLFISTTPTAPSTSDYIEYAFSLPAYGTLSRTGLVLSNNYSLGATATGTGVNAVAWCIDSTA